MTERRLTQRDSQQMRTTPLAPGLAPLVGLRADLVALSAMLLLSLLVWTLAYQVPVGLDLAIGGDRVANRREDDRPFLQNVHDSEPDQRGVDWRTLPPGYSYRWTRSDSTLLLPGAGGGGWLLTIHADSGRPNNQAASSTWQLGNQQLELTIPPGGRIYRLLAQANANGDVQLRMQTAPYISANDPRELGLVLREVRATPLATGLHAPALPQLGWLTAILVLVYVLARGLALGRYPALLLVGSGMLVSAALLATQRFALTLFTPTLTLLLLSCSVIPLLLRGAYAVWSRPASLPLSIARLPGGIIALVLLAFALRLGGMLHPHAIFSDHVFNANNLFKVGLGQVYLSAGLPAEAGGGTAPYPPGLYLLLLPAQLLFPPDTAGRVLLVQAGTALLDSLVLALIWLLLRHAGLSQRAAYFGAACYLLPPPLLESFSIGEYANIGGQVLALPAIALLAWNWVQWESSRGYGQLWVWVPLLAIGLLGHFGVAISLATLLIAAWLMALGQRQVNGRVDNSALGRLTVAGALAALLVGLIYYSAPLYIEIFAQRLLGSSANATTAEPWLATLGHTLLSLIGLERPQGRNPLPIFLVTGCLIGLLIIWIGSQNKPRQRGLAALIGAWWLGVLLSQGLMLIASQGVRWSIFLYPALCLGVGPALATLWRRGGAGRVVSSSIVAATLLYGLIIWITQIRDYLH